MFSVSIKSIPIVNIVDDIEVISEGNECTLIYNGRTLHFIEQNGLYAHVSFFGDMYYDEYQLFLYITSGGWNDSLSNLIQTLGFIDISIDDEDEEIILSFITRLKNGEGIPVFYGCQERIMLKNYE